jgi:hypothetical protein
MSIFSGIIDSTLRDIYNDGEIEMWRGLGQPCTLIFPAIRTVCANCNNSIIGNLPGNVLQDGMPVPVFAQSCPNCGGQGFRESIATESIKMQINVDAKSFLSIFQKIIIEAPQDFIETKARLEDLPSIMKCSEAILNTTLSGYKEYRCTRASEAVQSGMFQNKFCHILWRRIG